MAEHKHPRGRSAKSYLDSAKPKPASKPKTTAAKPKRKYKRLVKTIKASPETADRKEQIIKQSSIDVIDRPKKDFRDQELLPENYQLTHVTLIARDPYWVFAYWNISSEAIDQLRGKIGDQINQGTFTLRLYDVTLVQFDGTNANRFTDYDELHMNNRYINVWSDDASYAAEIGLRLYDGTFHAISRSNFVTTPRSRMSQRNDMIWKSVTIRKESPAFVNLKMIDRNNRKGLAPRTNWQRNTSRVTLSADDIMSYYTVGGRLIDQLDQETLNLLYLGQDGKKLTGAKDFMIESSVIPGLISKNIYKMKSVGASEELQAERQSKSFYFEIDTELIVKGRTEPGADVYLGGRKIDVNQDGTFTLKYHLPEGYFPFDFTARSELKDMQKSITTAVVRTKTRNEEKA
ncbi:MAG: DUF4912 domain-containing protein [Candidatus Omnitrophica bacterium]|nr:DUF4912 domain-containing protein [Candidatus Omnitrophota bacterium]